MVIFDGPLCILFTKTSACRKDFDETKYMPFFIKDNELLEKYNEIGKTSAVASGKDLIVNLYTLKNI